MVLRAALVLVVTLLLAAGDQARAQSDAVKAMAGSGGWEISNADRDKTCTVFVTAKSGGKKVEAHWAFTIDETGGGAPPTASAAPSAPPKK